MAITALNAGGQVAALLAAEDWFKARAAELVSARALVARAGDVCRHELDKATEEMRFRLLREASWARSQVPAQNGRRATKALPRTLEGSQRLLAILRVIEQRQTALRAIVDEEKLQAWTPESSRRRAWKPRPEGCLTGAVRASLILLDREAWEIGRLLPKEVRRRQPGQSDAAFRAARRAA